MIQNNGFLMEEEFVNALNNKDPNNLPNNLNYFIKQLFGVFINKEVIYCELVEGSQKPDIKITYKGIVKYVSLKTGKAQNVHEEYIEKFIPYLREKGISKQTIITILLFHFGDGTIDGTGEKRLGYHEISLFLTERIKKANLELNSNKEFVKEFIDRCIFDGAIEGFIPADCIYDGTLEYGVFVTRKQIHKHIESKSFSYYKSLHIGPLLLRPHARYTDGPIKNDRKRKVVVCYWPNLFLDLLYIFGRYNG